MSIALGLSSGAHSIECASSKCYIDVYNSVDPTKLPQLDAVNEIHRKLITTIGSQQALLSRLVVIDSDGHPWAVALSDNAIILTKGAIESMYRGVNKELGDARVAFVLGHELSHLVTDDLFHHKAFVINQSESSAKAYLQARPEEELRADLRGYTFASIAGYRTDLLLGGDNDFFRNWLSQITGGVSSKTHPDNESRRKFIEKGFQNIIDHLPYYHFSIALAHFGYYADAQYLLEDHLNLVETEEAYSNLGYVHIQLARQLMPVDMAYKYWIPTLLETDSALELKRRRSLFGEKLPQEAMDHLMRAEMILLKAASMNQNSLTTHINLAAVYLYMPDKLHRAYASIEDALRTPLGKVRGVRDQLESIYQLIRVKDKLDGGDRWPKARDTLTTIASAEDAPANLLFNLARMLDDRGRDDTAKRYWNRLLERVHSIPPAYQSHVCFRLRTECVEQNNSSPWIHEKLPLGKDIRYPEVKRYLAKNWSSTVAPVKQLPGLKAQVFANREGDALLALDNHLEMMILRNVPTRYRDLNELQKEFGEPYVYLPMLDGQLLAFDSGWSAFVREETVAELWITKLD